MTRTINRSYARTVLQTFQSQNSISIAQLPPRGSKVFFQVKPNCGWRVIAFSGNFHEDLKLLSHPKEYTDKDKEEFMQFAKTTLEFLTGDERFEYYWVSFLRGAIRITDKARSLTERAGELQKPNHDEIILKALACQIMLTEQAIHKGERLVDGLDHHKLSEYLWEEIAFHAQLVTLRRQELKEYQEAYSLLNPI